MKKVVFALWLMIPSFSGAAQQLAKTADSIRVAAEIPGLAYAVLNSDSILTSRVLGYRRADRKVATAKVVSSDFFHLGSNTKAVTGFIAACLVEQVKIRWSTKFFALFPELKKDANPAFYEISLSDLLGHRALIKPYMSGEEFELLPKFSGNKSEQRKAFVTYLLRNDALAKNDEPFNYSNAGYSVAALMLEKASGKTWEELVQEVFKKAGLAYHMGWPNSVDSNQPWGHWIVDGVLTALPPTSDYKLQFIEPAGDLSMTIGDYAKFVQLNLSGLRGKNNLLKAETYNYLHFGHDKYASGWLNVNGSGKQLSEHAGSAGTFYCYTLVNKDKNIAYIIMANVATEKALKGIFQLLEKMIKTTEASMTF